VLKTLEGGLLEKRGKRVRVSSNTFKEVRGEKFETSKL